MDGGMRKHRFAITILLTSLTPPAYAETVSMVNDQAGYYTYSVGVSIWGCDGYHDLGTGAYSTKAEALAAGLGLHLTAKTRCICISDYFVTADANPDNWQLWEVCHLPTGDSIGHSVFPISARYNPPGKHCPTPTIQPKVPYTPNADGKTCSRPDQNSYSITLSGSTTIEPSNSSSANTLPFIASVKDTNTGQPPTTPVTVRIRLKVDPTSGGHEHGDSNRPRGGIADVKSCESDETCWSGQTDGSGKVVFNFNAPEAAGTHTITAECDECSKSDPKVVEVKVSGLEKIPEIPFLYTIKLPNRDTNHPATYYLTRASAEKLKTIALYYYAFTFTKPKPTSPDFVLNDASLEWGGVLDCFLTCNSALYPSTPWHKHHVEHRRGSVVDIKANGDLGSIVYDDVFRSVAKRFHVDVGRLHGSGSGLHYHLRLNNLPE